MKILNSRWLSDFAFVDSLFVVNCSLVLSSLCVFVFPFVTSYAMLLTVGAFFGLSIAAYISLTRCQNISSFSSSSTSSSSSSSSSTSSSTKLSIVLVDLRGLEKLTSAFGLLTMFRGAASIVGPPIAGEDADHIVMIDTMLMPLLKNWLCNKSMLRITI